MLGGFLKGLLLAFVITFYMFTNSNAQHITKNDSLRIENLIKGSNSSLMKYNYDEAIDLAYVSYLESDSLSYSSGIKRSLLLLADAYKAKTAYSSSLNYYLQAEAEIEKQKNVEELVRVNYKTGELFFEWGVPEKALAYFNKVLAVEKGVLSETDKIELLNRKAETHLKLNQNGKALDTYNELLKVFRKNDNKEQIINTLKKIASVYTLQNRYEDALTSNFEILEVNKQLNDTASMATSCNGIGFLYKSLSKLPEALSYFEQALEYNELMDKKGANKNAIISNLINIGVIYQSLGDYRGSIRSFNKALKVVEGEGSDVEIAVIHNYLASIYYNSGNYPEARKHTQHAIDLLQGTENIRMLASSQKRLSHIYEKTGNYEKALESYQEYSVTKDSLLYRQQLNQEKEQYKQFLAETVEKQSKLELIDQEMKALELRNEKVKSEKEKQEIELQLKEQQLQNASLANEQLQREKQMQKLVLIQEQIEAQKKDQEITVLEQKRDLQALQLKQSEILKIERQKELELQKSKLDLQESQLKSSKERQQYLIWTAGLFFVILILIFSGFIMKRRDNKILLSQYEKINEQKEKIELINKELVQLNEEKNSLIGIVAHDLKSPLNQISGILDIIKLTSRGQTKEQQEYMEKIFESVKRLRNMVTKILDVNAIESKTLNLKTEKVDLPEVLNEVISRFEEMANKKGIAIHKQIESNLPPVNVDVEYTSEVFENLLSNAVKYSPLDEEITVKMAAQNSSIRIEFIDKGQGISREDMKNLFGRYHKLSARPTAGEDSTGLGLSIVKKYVEAMNGKVWCESEEGKGSNFIVEFDMYQVPV